MKWAYLLWTISTIIPSAISGYCPGFDTDPPGLRFGADGQFKITEFGDLHFGEVAWPECAEFDGKTTKVMNDILNWEPTDLAVLNGDLVSGEAIVRGDQARHIENLFRPFVDGKIPWASTYGNHDNAGITNTTELFQQEMTYNDNGMQRQAWTQRMVDGDNAKVGVTNYYIPVYSRTGCTSGEIALLLWFFGSRGSDSALFGPLDDYVAPEVVGWYTNKQAELKAKYNRVVPSLAFVHSPIKYARNLSQMRKKNRKISPGIDYETGDYQGDGCVDKKQCSQNAALFANALADTAGLLAVFSNHLHRKDWCMRWPGKKMSVCFGRRTGYGGYEKGFAKGARKIRVWEDSLEKGGIDTWVRLEGGSISGHVSLNETFGVDKYAAAPNQDGLSGKSYSSTLLSPRPKTKFTRITTFSRPTPALRKGGPRVGRPAN